MRFLNNLTIGLKLNLIAAVNIVILLSIIGVVYNKLDSLNYQYSELEKISNIGQSIGDATANGLVLASAFKFIAINPNDLQAKNNFMKAIKNLDKYMKELETYNVISKGYKKFDIAKSYKDFKNELNIVESKINSGENVSTTDYKSISPKWRDLKFNLLKWSKANKEKAKKDSVIFKEVSDSTLYTIIVAIVISVVLISILISFIANNIKRNLRVFKEGLENFFSFIKRESSEQSLIQIDGRDEFSQMAQEVNTMIAQVSQEIEEDSALVKEIDDVIQKVDNGFYYYTVKGSSINPLTMSMKEKVNNLVTSTNEQLHMIIENLNRYGQNDFTFEYDSKTYENMNGSFGSLVAVTMLIGNNVSELIAMILNAGERLDHDTNILSQTSKNLSKASNEQAASLEETAAALEEITSTIVNNNANIDKIIGNSKTLRGSVDKGQNLANETALSMDEINEQVSAINEAIAVIDQIAFQTNILSLNAAVEAATAGEAGKGFAVVAGEVRNLASRSAEAAKEIKDIVEKATNKADNGKRISAEMIKGYEELNGNIQDTVHLIDEISSASKEQESGISQINDAVAALDQETQRNAAEAAKIDTLVQEVSQLSNDLVQVAKQTNYKEEAREQVSDVELVSVTAKLKNDHIVFKDTNFKTLDSYTKADVTDHHNCHLGKWIDEQVSQNKPFTQTRSWEKFLSDHKTVHAKVKEYMYRSADKADNDELKKISQEIEQATIAVFQGLNQVKIDNGKVALAE